MVVRQLPRDERVDVRRLLVLRDAARGIILVRGVTARPYAFQSVHAPIATNPIPATHFKVLGET